jgi:hypothetical protein
MQPESSDGFASVGTILPKEEAALLPGGLFAFGRVDFRIQEAIWSAGSMTLVSKGLEDFVTANRMLPIGRRSTFLLSTGSEGGCDA